MTVLCVDCKRVLKFGRFAYKQELCWKCFVQSVRDIMDKMSNNDRVSEEECEKVKYMLDVVAEVFGYKTW